MPSAISFPPKDKRQRRRIKKEHGISVHNSEGEGRITASGADHSWAEVQAVPRERRSPPLVNLDEALDELQHRVAVDGLGVYPL